MINVEPIILAGVGNAPVVATGIPSKKYDEVRLAKSAVVVAVMQAAKAKLNYYLMSAYRKQNVFLPAFQSLIAS